MSTFNMNEKDLKGKQKIKHEHIKNNTAVRKMLTESGIYPEKLAIEEDIKKLERKYTEEEVNQISDNKLLSSDILEIDISRISDENEIKKISNIIKNNQGNSTLRIYYGDNKDLKVIEKDIQINSEVINQLRKYLVITDSSVNYDE
ncbi:MAG: hypothetical protein Q9M91_02910 [Candidatus Dojkabacteria bacterium]|nr:hypothetical protein [Candidatus Dojkabacteria bacterium]MDQ7020774.1 hypothetical protein [Candidatus Dojkabacteria bacterium]